MQTTACLMHKSLYHPLNSSKNVINYNLLTDLTPHEVSVSLHVQLAPSQCFLIAIIKHCARHISHKQCKSTAMPNAC